MPRSTGTPGASFGAFTVIALPAQSYSATSARSNGRIAPGVHGRLSVKKIGARLKGYDAVTAVVRVGRIEVQQRSPKRPLPRCGFDSGRDDAAVEIGHVPWPESLRDRARSKRRERRFV